MVALLRWQVAACGLDVGMEYLRLEDVEVALQYFQKCLKVSGHVD